MHIIIENIRHFFITKFYRIELKIQKRDRPQPQDAIFSHVRPQWGTERVDLRKNCRKISTLFPFRGHTPTHRPVPIANDLWLSLFPVFRMFSSARWRTLKTRHLTATHSGKRAFL